ncbi:MAG: hypothetical protein AAF613_09205 [Pseudomonadota bacterium]
MAAIFKTIFEYGPLIFAFGFMAPLLAQIIEKTALTPPFGLTPLMTGLIVGGLYGLVAQIRGRWI